MPTPSVSRVAFSQNSFACSASPSVGALPLTVSARDVAEQISAAGGVMTLPGVPLLRHLVGVMEWDGENRVLWFTAFGDHQDDAHAISFDEICVHPVGVCFMSSGGTAAFLSPIEKAAVSDPEDYRVAWRLWQQVLPIRQRAIAESLEQLAAQAEVSMPRGFDGARWAGPRAMSTSL